MSFLEVWNNFKQHYYFFHDASSEKQYLKSKVIYPPMRTDVFLIIDRFIIGIRDIVWGSLFRFF